MSWYPVAQNSGQSGRVHWQVEHGPTSVGRVRTTDSGDAFSFIGGIHDNRSMARDSESSSIIIRWCTLHVSPSWDPPLHPPHPSIFRLVRDRPCNALEVSPALAVRASTRAARQQSSFWHCGGWPEGLAWFCSTADPSRRRRNGTRRSRRRSTTTPHRGKQCRWRSRRCPPPVLVQFSVVVPLLLGRGTGSVAVGFFGERLLTSDACARPRHPRHTRLRRPLSRGRGHGDSTSIRGSNPAWERRPFVGSSVHWSICGPFAFAAVCGVIGSGGGAATGKCDGERCAEGQGGGGFSLVDQPYFGAVTVTDCGQ